MTRDPYWKVQTQLVLAALLLFIAAAMELWRAAGTYTRRSVVAAITLVVVGFGLLFSAATVRTWCAPREGTMGALTWGDHSWHEPDLRDCFAVHRATRNPS